MADECTEEGRAAADGRHRQQESPAGQPDAARVIEVARQWRNDAESFGGIVEREADDQNGGQSDLVAGGGLPDGESFREVVKADADRDHQRQLLRR
ncbi:hypothetical protein [Aeromicrobium sp.]|uniref:hypothetical protein n=1 Tax=Aeromicrobium sp. TaxID=1871063 RepID=UPI0025BCC975|nr:hypothetical protein [Aeromicrobium sp.]